MKKRRTTTRPGRKTTWAFSLVLCSILFMHVFSYNASACEPDCGPCMHWDADEGDDGECVLDSGATCSEDSDCGPECGDCTWDCQCEDRYTRCPGGYLTCYDCVAGTCEWNCTDPNLPACHLGNCVQCVSILDCDLCETCEYNQCKHPCDDCVWSEYCGDSCFCAECTVGAEDTTTCSTSNNSSECDCSINIFFPCSGSTETIVYTGNSLESCTGDDCETRNDVLCYNTYSTCEVSGLYHPLSWCTQPTPEIGDECTFNNDIPSAGCYNCAPDQFESGIETTATRGVCPFETPWPPEE